MLLLLLEIYIIKQHKNIVGFISIYRKMSFILEIV